MTPRVALALAALALVAPGPASAQTWLAAEVPAAWSLSQPQATTFGAGALPALGVYRGLTPVLALGVRGRAGVLADGKAMSDGGLRDPGAAGLGTVSLVARRSAAGFWLEGGGGVGITGHDVVPAAEIGAGWSAQLGPVALGPSLRYLHVVAVGGVGLGSADLALLGLELRSRTRSPRRGPAPRVASASPAPIRDHDRLVDRGPACVGDPTGCAAAAVERDGDPVVELLESCRAIAAAIGDATAGCGAPGPVQVAGGRLILDERVLFAVSRARVRRRARPVVAAIATVWKARTRPGRLRVEGHADVRGGARFNLWLSQERAARVRAALIAAGVPAGDIEAVGHGATRPRSADHAANRRVEFVILSGADAP